MKDLMKLDREDMRLHLAGLSLAGQRASESEQDGFFDQGSPKLINACLADADALMEAAGQGRTGDDWLRQRAEAEDGATLSVGGLGLETNEAEQLAAKDAEIKRLNELCVLNTRALEVEVSGIERLNAQLSAADGLHNAGKAFDRTWSVDSNRRFKDAITAYEQARDDVVDQLAAADKLCEVTTRACEQLVLGCERKKVHDAIDAYKQARETQP